MAKGCTAALQEHRLTPATWCRAHPRVPGTWLMLSEFEPGTILVTYASQRIAPRRR